MIGSCSDVQAEARMYFSSPNSEIRMSEVLSYVGCLVFDTILDEPIVCGTLWSASQGRGAWLGPGLARQP